MGRLPTGKERIKTFIVHVELKFKLNSKRREKKVNAAVDVEISLLMVGCVRKKARH